MSLVVLDVLDYVLVVIEPSFGFSPVVVKEELATRGHSWLLPEGHWGPGAPHLFTLDRMSGLESEGVESFFF